MFSKKARPNHHPRKQVIASFTLNHENGESSVLTGGMGPPPRRSAPLPICTDTQSPSSGSNSASSSDEEYRRVESPPSRNHLMLFSEVAAAAAAPPKTAEPQVLGKSLDSSRSTFLTYAANALHSLKKAPPTTPPHVRRIRAESYDERALKMRGAVHNPAVGGFGSSSSNKTNGIIGGGGSENGSMGNDPTLEFQLRRPRSGSEPLVEMENESDRVVPGQPYGNGQEAIVRRERSASLGVLANLCVDARKGGVCDTITEDSREHEGVFEMDDTMEG